MNSAEEIRGDCSPENSNKTKKELLLLFVERWHERILRQVAQLLDEVDEGKKQFHDLIDELFSKENLAPENHQTDGISLERFLEARQTIEKEMAKVVPHYRRNFAEGIFKTITEIYVKNGGYFSNRSLVILGLLLEGYERGNSEALTLDHIMDKTGFTKVGSRKAVHFLQMLFVRGTVPWKMTSRGNGWVLEGQ